MKKSIGFLVLLILVISGCNKEEGPGGFSKISGTLIIKEVNKYDRVLKTYPAYGEDIYIVYGNNKYFDDDVETSHDGYFEFTNLTAGDYTLWYYSDDTSSFTGSEKTFISCPIFLGKKESITMDTLVSYNIRDIEDGTSSISGIIYHVDYRLKPSGSYDTTDIIDISPAQEADVYIVYENDAFYFERTRTHFDGTFQFTDLIKGNYRIYMYSEDIPGGIYDTDSENVLPEAGTTNLAIYRDVAVTGDFQSNTIDPFYIENILEIEDGTSAITGKVFLITYWTSAIPPYDTSSDIQAITPAQDLDVYIIYNNADFFFERTRTNYNGIFRFDNLIEGNFRVYVYSEYILGGIYNSNSENVIYDPNSFGAYDRVIYRDTTITQKHQEVTVSDMYIEENQL